METKDNTSTPVPAEIPVGVVGLGLMGSSIVTCLLIAGHPVVGIAPLPIDLETAKTRIHDDLAQAFEQKICPEQPAYYLKNLTITEDYNFLKNTLLVIESTLEDIKIKKQVYQNIENVVNDHTIITSNTSAIPISLLQKETRIPSRFLGLHWAAPAQTTRFLEIICGDNSDQEKADWLYKLSHYWAKEPTLVRKDIRGFITNRLMYALYREAFYLVENGYASIDDVDRACRNNAGYWMTLVGCFRWMDLTGIPAYHAVMKDLFPTLHNGSEIPKLIDDIVKEGGKGVLNAHGFYEYTPEEARLWRETYEEFSYDIRQLALKYPVDVVKKKLEEEKKRNN
jgi:3-hydroxybutyryl-CoA dehydrogenase